MEYTSRNLYVLIVLLVVVSSLIISCDSSDQSANQQQVEDYQVLELEPRSIELTNSYPATLEGQQTVEIRPRVQGYITQMHVDEGDWVEKGQVLFSLNSEEFEQQVRSARADVQAAKASVSTAEDEVERQQNLVDKDIVSNYQLQSAKNTLESNKASLAQAQANLENARVNLGYTEVKSPASGIIDTIPYRIGSLVNSSNNQPLTIVSDISEMYAYFSMSERELLEMAQSISGEEGDQTIQERVANMPDVNLVLPDDSRYNHQGKLKLASGLINKETGSASFRAVFPNPKEILRSGGSARVEIPFRHDSTIVIPKRTTYEIQNRRFVYVVTEDGTVDSIPISVLSSSTKQLFVVEEGLTAGDKIISSGTGQISDGDKINPQPVNADSLYQALTVTDQP